MRSGNSDDWRNIRWSVFDLGGVNGTTVNLKKIDSEVPYLLNCNDLLGIGCPDAVSTEGHFVYR